tara:strand:- start:369 stop:554 length:186 start_codon:yes stop_codon:yes gene_type:complete
MPKKPSALDTAKYWTYGWGGTGLAGLSALVKYGLGGKEGGRVTPRGIGVAKRGFGKALRKK